MTFCLSRPERERESHDFVWEIPLRCFSFSFSPCSSGGVDLISPSAALISTAVSYSSSALIKSKKKKGNRESEWSARVTGPSRKLQRRLECVVRGVKRSELSVDRQRGIGTHLGAMKISTATGRPRLWEAENGSQIGGGSKVV